VAVAEEAAPLFLTILQQVEQSEDLNNVQKLFQLLMAQMKAVLLLHIHHLKGSELPILNNCQMVHR
jgi:hypothetical protein